MMINERRLFIILRVRTEHLLLYYYIDWVLLAAMYKLLLHGVVSYVLRTLVWVCQTAAGYLAWASLNKKKFVEI